MKTIKKERAQQIAANWHGGQWSALYQFASSGIYTEENALHYLREIEDCLHPEYNLYPGFLSQKNEKELNSLKNYFLKIGLPVRYEKHPVYGYLVPFLNEPNPKVKRLHYLI